MVYRTSTFCYGFKNKIRPDQIDTGYRARKFPKSFQSSTSTANEGYTKYRRFSPDDSGHITVVRNQEINNRVLSCPLPPGVGVLAILPHST
ncbi:hypothetical protein PR048_021654 [Dryococelus australis]|uniref:Uncharacterized protein n=1 Tax=Dryococelus australis TaxID=614101 RepID=A0ABQ9GYU4_9NEOP|nr:hypothetical protein PR048_021654 [Dryococelus australis]